MPIKKNIKKKQINWGNRRRGIKEMIRIEIIKIISGK
jgi:succinate dehydrogenase flavin-adding protein (antitoxin of CptAB toxin-antitoxin module)